MQRIMTSTFPVVGRALPRWLALCMIAGFALPAAGQTQEAAAAAKAPAAAEATPAELFKDFLHYARLGRFQLADANAAALLTHPDLDAVQVMQLANRDRKSVDTLLIIIKHSTIGENASKVLDLIQKGEELQRQDFERIRANIDNLCGTPQQEFFATKYLTDSGEYAIPHLVEFLLHPSDPACRPRVVHAMTKLGKAAVNPLVMALRVADDVVRLNLIRALGEIGYPQAIPYLAELIASEGSPEQTRQAAKDAVQRIAVVSGRDDVSGSASQLFSWLAERYYDEEEAVGADPRLEMANVWFWDEGEQAVTATPVPQRLFGPLMAMRCSEEALTLQPDHVESVSLWLAADVRRESRMGLNVESGAPGEAADLEDATHAADFPRAQYFARAAGPRYAHLMLARAVQDRDTAVALGAIEALRVTAGESSLIGTEDFKQPLVQALRFPDLLVRIRAALALGSALPRSPFADSQYVMPIVAQAIGATSNERMVIIGHERETVNRLAGELRSDDRAVIAEVGFFEAMERGRSEFPSVDAFVVSASVSDPDVAGLLSQLRGEFQFLMTPVVLLASPAHSIIAEDLAAQDAYVEPLDSGADAEGVAAAVERIRERTGQLPMSDSLSSAIAHQAVETLRRIALDGRTVFDIAVAEQALAAALTSSSDEDIRLKCASVLALTQAPSAQSVLATVAMDGANSTTLRIALFASLAESAKINGHMLGEKQTTELVRLAREEADMTIRTAASQALGAINLASNQASEIIRSFHGG